MPPKSRSTPHGPSQPDAVDGVLAALADPMRRRLLDLLAAHGQATATLLAGELPVSRQAVMQQLVVLEQAGLVGSHRVGRERRYRVQPAPLTTTADWMARTAQRWDDRLAMIAAIAETPGPGVGTTGPAEPVATRRPDSD